MPELPDIVAYLDALNSRVVQKRLRRVKLFNPFVLRSVDPPLDAVQDQEIADVRRIGKRIVLGFSAASSTGDRATLSRHPPDDCRPASRWREPDVKLGLGPRIVLATFEFEHGTLLLHGGGFKKRASITLVRGEPALRALDPGGLEPLEVTIDQFRDALTRAQHTLKRSLTDPHLFSGIGNAYSDEILHAAQLSPLKLTRSLSDEEVRRLFDATRKTLELWMDRFRAEARGGFPEKVTAFREGMAVHGRFKQPCPRCGSPVQRIVYADNECNYCARCQTGGRLLADRSLSRLLRDDWPKWLKIGPAPRAGPVELLNDERSRAGASGCRGDHREAALDFDGRHVAWHHDRPSRHGGVRQARVAAARGRHGHPGIPERSESVRGVLTQIA